jgi:hypothetical protein
MEQKSKNDQIPGKMTDAEIARYLKENFRSSKYPLFVETILRFFVKKT